MDIPGLALLPQRILSECGLVSGMLVFALGWVGWQLAKTRAAWEADRTAMAKLRDGDRDAILKVVMETTASEGKIAVALNRVEAIVIALQARGVGD